MASPHSDILRSQRSLTNTGKQEAVRTDRRKKTGSMQRKICDLSILLENATDTSVSEETETRRRHMRPSTTDQVKGKIHEVKGQLKKKTGQLTNDRGLAAEGQAEKTAGTIQKKIGQVEAVFEK
jgi:uncharacterized protein YjbJ (UPF0337 family)